MEAKLAKWLDRATSWNGIVLIDEADIYLERREKEDLSRNSLVTGTAPFLTFPKPTNNDQPSSELWNTTPAPCFWYTILSLLHPRSQLTKSDYKPAKCNRPRLHLSHPPLPRLQNPNSFFPPPSLGRLLQQARTRAKKTSAWSAAPEYSFLYTEFCEG